MNLSLIFMVLSAFIAYILYDMFKKSRQQQELILAQDSTPLKSSQCRLKPNYQLECALLHHLHDEKLTALKHRNISIHLREDEPAPDFTTEKEAQVVTAVRNLLQGYNVYLLVWRKKEERNQWLQALRKGGVEEIGFEGSEGGVAVLRQLKCGTHLQGELSLYNILVQYLPVVWLAHPVKQDVNNQFGSQLQMLLNLQAASARKGKEMKQD